jgi:hypothetical protein
MNERFMELAGQAGLYVDLEGSPWPRAMSAEECEAAYKKFAELIVQECAKLIRDKSSSIVKKAEIYAEPDADEIDAAKATAWQFLVLEQQMKKHFGVE